MDKKVKSHIFYAVTWTFLAIAIVYLYRNDIKMLFNRIFAPASIESLNLTMEEKLNDFAFYCAMTAIIEDLASNHTGFCFPDYEDIKALNCYKLENVLADRRLKPVTDYWNKVIGEACESLSEVKAAEFKYIDGKYVFDPKWSDESYDELSGYHIVSVDDVGIDRYILEHISIYKLQYDSANDIPYRRVFTLNESVGEKVSVILEDEDGRELERELYASVEMEVVNTYSDEYEETEHKVQDESIIHFYDSEDDILYVCVKNFQNSEGDELEEIFGMAGENTDIIIDFRDNYGGNVNYGKKFIYPYLYDKDVSFEQNWFVPKSEYNSEISKSIISHLLYRMETTDQGTKFETTSEYEGGSMDRSSHIFYLVGQKTASAADEYIAMIQENDLGTVIGTDTAGEGLGGSFVACMLENSGWVFSFYPCQAMNADGTNNAVIGTAPDIYKTQSVESFYRQRSLEREGIDTETYENRLQWDNVLIETLDSIRERKGV